VKKLFLLWIFRASICLLFFILSCSKIQKYSHNFFALDTNINITIYSSFSNVQIDIDTFVNFVNKYEELLSISNRNSEVWKINHRTDSIVKISNALKPIIKVAQKEFNLSGGLFDITVEPFKTLYGLESHQRQNRVPSQKEIDSALAFVGFEKIRFVNDSVFIMPQNMKFDFGGIAKGLILIEAINFLKQKKHSGFLINLGGDIAAFGTKPSKESWIIGIQDPRNPDNLIATLKLKEGCVFTSGDYERYFIDSGKRYHHIFNPKTGTSGTINMSATVIGKDPLEIDAVVKSVFLMPPQKALQYLESRGMQGLIIDSTKTGWANQSLKNLISLSQGFEVNFR